MTLKFGVGIRPRFVIGDTDFQCVIKQGVGTWPKNACVSTPLLKWYLIVSQLQHTPWPRPDVASALAKVWPCPAWEETLQFYGAF